jgi:hypothetical protein
MFSAFFTIAVPVALNTQAGTTFTKAAFFPSTLKLMKQNFHP